MAGEKAASLWQDYAFLTNEMLKFVSSRDMDMFYNLLAQRSDLQKLIESTPDDGFKQSAAGRKLFVELIEVDKAVEMRLQLGYNQATRQQEINQSYEGFSTQGGRIDFQR